MSRRATSVRSGSTLIELLVVLSILAVVAVVVAPGLPVNSRVRESQVSTLRAARATAIRAATPIRAAEGDGAAVRLIFADPMGRVVVDSTRGAGREPRGTP